MTKLSFYLQARNPERNISRQYSVVLGQDLFGAWMLHTNFERIGRKGREISYTFSSKEEAYQKIKPIVKKRASAQNRLGCSYQLIEYCRHPCLKEIEILPFLPVSLVFPRECSTNCVNG